MARKTDFTNNVDLHIGAKVHELRISKGLSRQQLAVKIDVTHQQLQKYEKGINRISAGRLLSIAIALNEDVSYFFEGLRKIPQEVPTQHQRMCIGMSRNFMKIKNPAHQYAVNNLVLTLSKEEK